MRIDLTVRPATVADLPAVQHVATTTWWGTYGSFMPAEAISRFLQGAYRLDRLAVRLKQAALLLVAERDGLVVGFGEYHRRTHPDEAVLQALYVLPGEQGKGVGSALLSEGIRLLTPIRQLYLEVEAENQKGRRFYERKGFRPVRAYEEPLGNYRAKLLEMVLEVDA